jgi:hypothetical protein
MKSRHASTGYNNDAHYGSWNAPLFASVSGHGGSRILPLFGYQNRFDFVVDK